MAKLDLVREFKELYRPPSSQSVVVQVPAFQYLMIDGQGDPNTSFNFRTAVEALYTASYTIKFKVKRADSNLDYKVMPLEGLWWADNMATFPGDSKSEWKWTLMIVQPSKVGETQVQEGLAEAARKKELSTLGQIRIESFVEGLCAQIMHLGPYSAEGPTIEKLHAYIAEHGYVCAGKHHEIYLGDPRRSAPDRLKTVIRQPIVNP
jgi:hypothetical protein